MIYLLIFTQLIIYTFSNGAWPPTRKTRAPCFSLGQVDPPRKLETAGSLSPSSPSEPLIHVFDIFAGLLGFVLQESSARMLFFLQLSLFLVFPLAPAAAQSIRPQFIGFI